MAFGFDDALIAGALVASSVASTAYSANKSKTNAVAMNKDSWKYYQKQKELDYQYDANQYLELDKKYQSWYKKLEYDWKKQYSQNSAKWTMDGLKAAGLNPILAASSGFTGSQLSSGSVSASRSSSGSALGHSADYNANQKDFSSSLDSVSKAFDTGSTLSANKDTAEANASVAKSTVDSQISTAKNQSDLLKAQELQAQANTTKALSEAKKTEAQTNDILRRRGMNSVAGDAMSLASHLDDLTKKVGTSMLNTAKSAIKTTNEPLANPPKVKSEKVGNMRMQDTPRYKHETGTRAKSVSTGQRVNGRRHN